MGDSRTHSRAAVEEVAVSSIIIGERRRKKMGSIATLVKSIEEDGLMHPIIVDGENRLVAGGRRLAAVQRIGWRKIPVRRFEKLTDDDLRHLELVENVQRLDLDSYEASRERMREIEAVVETCPGEGQVSKPARGPSKTTGSLRDVAQKTSLSKNEVARTRKHVSVAEEFPGMQRPEWKKSHVLRVDDALGQLEPEQRQAFGEMVSDPEHDPRDAVALIENVAEMPSADRKRVARLYESGDPEKRERAISLAMNLPPPIPGELMLAKKLLPDMKRIPDMVSRKHKTLAKNAVMALEDLHAALSRDYQAMKAKEMNR